MSMLQKDLAASRATGVPRRIPFGVIVGVCGGSGSGSVNDRERARVPHVSVPSSPARRYVLIYITQ